MFFLNYQNQSLLELRNAQTKLATLSKPKADFLYAAIQEFAESQVRKDMLKAQDYYVNKNDINEAKRTYIDRYGTVKEANNLSNSKLAHPFLRKLVNQKVNHLLSKEFSIQCDDETFAKALAPYMDKQFIKLLKAVGSNAIVNGIAWVEPYYDEMGKLQFKRIPSEEVIPFWIDIDHTRLEGVVRTYKIVRYGPEGSKTEIIKVEYHTTQGVWYFVQDDRGLQPDPDHAAGIQGHFTVNQPVLDEIGNPMIGVDGSPESVSIQATWDRLPFIPFKYNADEVSILQWVKAMIDDYDKNTSNNSNTLLDTPNSIKVVRNYDGANKEEFVQNLNLFRTAFVSGDGDMTGLEVTLDTAATEAHLIRLRKDIYEAGNAVDTQSNDLGNASGVALKFRYADLDMDMDGMAAEFASALDDLIWFIKTDLLNNGGPDYLATEFDVLFNMGGIINESEIITDAKNSAGIISDETIRANHPWVTDADAETKRLEDEKEQAMKDMEDQMILQANSPLNGGSGSPTAPKKLDPNKEGTDNKPKPTGV